MEIKAVNIDSYPIENNSTLGSGDCRIDENTGQTQAQEPQKCRGIRKSEGQHTNWETVIITSQIPTVALVYIKLLHH